MIVQDEAAAGGVEKVCAEIAAATKDILSWEWDGRFEAALTAFTQTDIARVTQAFAPVFPHSFDAISIAGAPPVVRGRVSAMGGLRGDQRLLVSAELGGAMLAAAWWPWGGGAKVSVRIMLAGGTGATWQAALRRGFGIA